MFSNSNRHAVFADYVTCRTPSVDAIGNLAEGGIIVSKVVREKKALGQQLLLYREFIRAVFSAAKGRAG